MRAPSFPSTGWRWALLVLAALLAALLVPAVPVGAQQARAVQATRYDVDLAVQADGRLLVRETQQIAFRGGPFQKGSRRIPVDQVEALRDVRVEEPGEPYRPGRDQPRTYAVSRPATGGRGELLVEWWFPQTANAERTFVISYTAAGALRYYPGGDQIRWQALGRELEYAIARGTITLRLPVDVAAGDWKTAAYPSSLLTGEPVAQGSTVTWNVANVQAKQGLEIRAQWPHGLVAGAPPSWQESADREAQRYENLRPVLTLGFGAAGLLIPVFGALAIFLAWYTRGRDPHVGSVPPELDSPPSDLPAPLVGTVVDEQADVQDVIATVLDLASRGVIRVSEVSDPQLAGSSRDFELELVQPDAETRPYERAVLDSFFHRGERVRLSRLGDWFAESIPVIQRALHAEVVREGLFVADPEVVRQRYRRLGTMVALGGVVLGFAACSVAGQYSPAIPWPFYGAAVVGLLLRWAADRMPKRTGAGAVEAARWRAYARHLFRVTPEQPVHLPRRAGRRRLSEESTEERGEDFERTLPYAVALGIDRSWVQRFATAGTPAPRWLGGPPVVVVGGPMWGGPMWGGPMVGGPWIGPGQPRPGGGAGGAGGAAATGAGGGGLQGASDSAAGGLEGASGSLTDLLNSASEVLGRGGGSGWSGGGFGGGAFGGGFGGSGGGGGGFE